MANRYWVGGTGTWNSIAGSKWATTSGGTGGEAVPTSADDVFFDANSGAVTITVTGPGGLAGDYTAVMRNFDCTGFTGTFVINEYGGPFSSYGNIEIYGSLLFSAEMTYNSLPREFAFKATTTGHTITTNGKTLVADFGTDITSHLRFDGTGGEWTLQDDLTSTGRIFLEDGTLDTNGKTVTALGILVTGSNTVLTLGGSLVSLSLANNVNGWQVNSDSTLNAGTSTIKFTGVSTFNVPFNGGGHTYNNVWFARGTSTGSNTISGSNTFADFKDDGSAAHSIIFTAGTTQTVTTFNVSGSAGKLITLKSTVADTQWILTDTTVTNISCDFISLQDSRAQGGACWFAGANSVNVGNNNGWAFTAPSGVCGGVVADTRGAALMASLAF